MICSPGGTGSKSGWERNIDENLLQIREYRGPGFAPVVDFGGWRVAILRSGDDTRAQGILSLERHRKTDEVFVLTEGSGVLLIGGKGPRVEGIVSEPMVPGKIYNVRRNVWHGILLSRQASVLIVENNDTATANSEYEELTTDQQSLIRDIEMRKLSR